MSAVVKESKGEIFKLKYCNDRACITISQLTSKSISIDVDSQSVVFYNNDEHFRLPLNEHKSITIKFEGDSVETMPIALPPQKQAERYQQYFSSEFLGKIIVELCQQHVKNFNKYY